MDKKRVLSNLWVSEPTIYRHIAASSYVPRKQKVTPHYRLIVHDDTCPCLKGLTCECKPDIVGAKAHRKKREGSN